MDALFGQHLFADIIHDFPGFRGPFYNIGGDLRTLPPPQPAVYYSENATSDRLLGMAAANPAFAARLNQKIVFTIPKTTSTFQKTEPPLIFQGGNEYAGIVQDAGEYITDFLGAKNVITFGSILDPASKPIGPTKNAIWYDVEPETNVTIPLSEFGFDPAIIQSITVGNLRGGGIVSAIFTTGGGAQYDAVKMVAYDPASPGSKPINNTKVEVSGFFTSIEGANLKALSRNLPPNQSVFFNIGKTLGDVMLVASIMPSFSDGTINNVFVQPGGQWRMFANDEATADVPQILVLKTGDILNHTRAILKNVPSILERQAGAGRVVKQYEFVPGYADPDAIYASFGQGYTKLVSDVTETYNTLINSFTECVSGGMLTPGRSDFSGSGDVVRTEGGRQRAAVIIEQITNGLGVLRDRVADYYTKRGTTALSLEKEQNDKIRDLYEIDLASFKFFVPQTLEVFDIRKNLMKPKIIVAQVPKGLPPGSAVPLPIGSTIEISMWNAFTKLDASRSRDLNELFVEIANTDLGKKFFARIPAPELLPAPAQVVPPQPITPETGQEILDTVSKIVEDVVRTDPDAELKSIEEIVGDLGAEPVVSFGEADQIDTIDADRELVGGGSSRKLRLDKEFKTELSNFWKTGYHYESIPETMYLFMFYLKNYPYFTEKSEIIAFNCVIEVCETGMSRSSEDFKTVLDVDLFEALVNDVSSIRRKFQIEPAPKRWGDNSIPTLASVLLFNAFTCHVNCENAKMFQTPDDVLVTDGDNEISQYYKAMENEFRKQALTFFRVTRSSTPLIVAGNRKTRKLKIKRKVHKTNRRQTYV